MVDGNITCKQENNWIGFSFVDTNFEGWMIVMVGNYLLINMNWSYQVQKNSNAPTPRPDVSYLQTKFDNKIGCMGMNLLLKSQQKFSNPSYRSDTVTVNYTRFLPQQLLHTIVSNQNISRREPIRLWVLFNESINIIKNNETITNTVGKWHIYSINNIFIKTEWNIKSSIFDFIQNTPKVIWSHMKYCVVNNNYPQ